MGDHRSSDCLQGGEGHAGQAGRLPDQPAALAEAAPGPVGGHYGRRPGQEHGPGRAGGAVPSRLPVARKRPLMSKLIAVIPCTWPASTGASAQSGSVPRVPASYSRTVPSAQPAASVVPDGLAARTVARYPSGKWHAASLPVVRSQVRIVSSSPADTSRPGRGPNATVRTAPL